MYQDAAVETAHADLYPAAIDGAAGRVIEFQLDHSLGLRSLRAARRVRQRFEIEALIEIDVALIAPHVQVGSRARPQRRG